MQSATQAVQVSNKMLWVGRIVSAIPIVLMLFGGIVKIMKLPSVVEGFAQYGYPERLVVPVGIIELSCTILYAIPRTSVLGAILLTGVFGGAIATNVRLGNPVFVAPLFVGVLVWAGLFWRDQRVRALIPLRSRSALDNRS